MTTISSFLSFPFKKEEQYLESLPIVPNEDNYEEKNSDKKEGNNDNMKKDDKENENLTLKESILSLDFFLCLTIASCTLIFGFLLANTYRSFGETSFVKKDQKKEDNDYFTGCLQTLSKVFTLLNTFSRLVWGYLSDKIRFKILYIIVCINQLICGSLIYFSSGNIVTYFIVVNLGVLSFSGHVILFPTLIHTKFGVENSVYLLGICGIFVGTAALVGPVITIFVLNDSDRRKYLYIYIIGAAPTIISLIITLFIKVERKQKKKTKSVADNYDDEEDDLTN